MATPTGNYNAHDFQQQAEALIPATVRMISGCHSEQTSADVSNVGSVAKLPNPAGRAGGACTSALLDILYGEIKNQYSCGKVLTFQDLLLKLRESLANTGFSQIPQLSSSRPLDVQETPFHLVGGTGARRALLVGINYCGQNGELSGCHNDVFNVKKYLTYAHSFPDQSITVLVDDGRNPYPTRQRIIAELKRLVAESVAGDSVYFHYSGHGGLLSPEANFFKSNNNEYDETIYPLDHERSGQIRDFSLFNHFVKPMPAGVTVTCVMDCCHSGTVLDLPYSFLPTEGGGIQMRQSMDHLSNLAFLYVLAGGLLPAGFEGVSHHIGEALGGANLEDYQGCGIESAEADEWTGDDTEYPDPDEDAMRGAYGNEADDDNFGAAGAEDEPVVVPGVDVPDDGYGGPPDFADAADVPGGGGFGGGDDAPGYAEAGGIMPESFIPAEASERAFGEGVDYDVQQDDDDGEGVDCGCLADALTSLLTEEDEE